MLLKPFCHSNVFCFQVLHNIGENNMLHDITHMHVNDTDQ